MSAPRQNKGQRNIDLSTTVRRNLNDHEFYRHNAQAQVQSTSANVYSQVEYNSINALEALATQNGFNFDTSVLGQASQQLAKLTEKQRNAYLRTTEQLQNLQHLEPDINRTCSSDSKAKKRRKSSRSKSEVDVENNPAQLSDCVSEVQSSEIENNMVDTPLIEKCTQQRPSRSNRKSVEEQHSVTEITPTKLINDTQALAPMSAMDVNIQQHATPNRTEKPISPNSGSKDHITCISPTLKLPQALKGMPLYVPKLVITKIRQRRGSKEVETHQVREVLPGSESDLQKARKRRRSSEERPQHISSDDLDEGKQQFSLRSSSLKLSCTVYITQVIFNSLLFAKYI